MISDPEDVVAAAQRLAVDVGQMREELTRNRRVVSAARALASFLYTPKGWRGEVNMKGILGPAADLKFSLLDLDGVGPEMGFDRGNPSGLIQEIRTAIVDALRRNSQNVAADAVNGLDVKEIRGK